MRSPSDIDRYEIKYLISDELAAQIRAHISPYTEADPYAAERPDQQYTVRSIYFDTSGFDFYYDKIDGLKIRKKLRLRVYNEFAEDAPAFLEIKRRYGRVVAKERTVLPLREAVPILVDRSMPDLTLEQSFNGKKVIGRFFYNLISKDLRPTALITYEREAFVGRMDDRVRVTLDKNVRSCMFPGLNQLFDDNDLRSFTDGRIILEMKFDGYMPKWFRNVVSRLGLRAQSVSKYCLGIEAWLRPGAFGYPGEDSVKLPTHRAAGHPTVKE